MTNNNYSTKKPGRLAVKASALVLALAGTTGLTGCDASEKVPSEALKYLVGGHFIEEAIKQHDEKQEARSKEENIPYAEGLRQEILRQQQEEQESYNNNDKIKISKTQNLSPDDANN